jgi:hypothetical protein
VRTGIPIDDRAIVLFRGADGKNGAVSLVVERVLYELDRNGTVTLVPERSSATKLTVTYMDESSEADVRQVSLGDF